MKKIAWMIAVVSLLASVLLVWIGDQKPGEASLAVPLDDLLPTQVAGWVVGDVPLGDTEYLAERSAKVLRFDQYSYRRYTKQKTYVDVYVAYWGAGKVPVEDVAGHTPDRCWTLAGWECSAMTSAKALIWKSTPWWPVEERLFNASQVAAPVHVWFWHLIGGKPNEKTRRFNETRDSPDRFAHHLARFTGGAKDQLFVRISSNQELEQVMTDATIEPLFTALAHALRQHETPADSAGYSR